MMKMDITYVILVCLISTVFAVQEFLETPQNQSVVQGAGVTFICRVANRVGNIQWVKNGDPLGFNPAIPGYPRYSVTTNNSTDFNLNIIDTQLSDDGTYECQVMPKDGNLPLRAFAVLTILVPPDMPEIEGYSNGSRVEVNESTPLLQLTCHARNARPAATIQWFKNGREITEDIIEYNTSPIPNDKRLNAKSVISIRGDLRNEQQGAEYTCRAKNDAITINTLQTTVVLNVLYPPGIPVITGYQSGTPVNAYNTVRMTCESVGGNPPPQVVWFRNNQKSDFSFSSGNGKSTNELVFTATPLDNGAIYRCESSNQASQLPLKTQVTLEVHFPPDKVTITGDKLGKAGEQIQLTCTSSHANPPASLIWLSKGLIVAGAHETTKPADDGGFITVSTLSVTLTNQESKVLFMCQAANYSRIVDTIELSVLYPPGEPVIEGYNKNWYAEAGESVSMKCVSSGGNPTATLKWFKNDVEMTADPQVVLGTTVTSDLTFVPKPSDNQVKIKCTASNEATVVPLETELILTVYFPPKYVNITFSPQVAREGQMLRLTCTSGPSYPAASIIWVKKTNGTRLKGSNLGNTQAANHGYLTTNILEIANPTADDDGAAYFCEATNLDLDKGYSDAVILSVKYKPVFNSHAVSIIQIVEGLSQTSNMTARGNPNDITYTLTLYKEGEEATPSTVSVTNGILDISSISKEDAGKFTLKAENAEGFRFHNFTIDVTYSAHITFITEKVQKSIGGTAVFECKAEANPMVPKMITWTREGFDMTKTRQDYDSSGKSYLTVTELAKGDSGKFKCTADNMIGDPATKEAELVIMYKPTIDKSPQYAKGAGDQGDNVDLTCKAEGSPDVLFKWSKGGTPIENEGQFEIYSRFIEGDWHLSELKIKNIQRENYGDYKCEAYNSNGTDSLIIKVDGTSIPDPPYDLKLVNNTHNSITISWKAGFWGGYPQTFTVIYRKVNSMAKTTIQRPENSGTVYTIKGLDRATEYLITVTTKNEHGPAKSSPKEIQVKTLLSEQGGDNQAAQSQDDDLPVIIILVVCVVGIFLLALNVGLILFFVRRRKKRLESNSDTTSHTNTVELYGPNKEMALYPMTPSDDSRSYGTYEKNMDGFSDDYSNYEDEDVKRVFLPPPAYSSYTPSKLDSPVMNHKTFLTDSRTYLDDPDRQWRYEDPYKINSRGKGTFDDYHGQMYEDDTRPKSITDFSDRSSHTASTSRLNGKTPPPQPPVRSSSKGATNNYCQSPVPPIPARNYDLDELPTPFEDERYVPAPGENYSNNIIPNPSYNGPIARAPSRTRNYPEDDMRGHLV